MPTLTQHINSVQIRQRTRKVLTSDRITAHCTVGPPGQVVWRQDDVAGLLLGWKTPSALVMIFKETLAMSMKWSSVIKPCSVNHPAEILRKQIHLRQLQQLGKTQAAWIGRPLLCALSWWDSNFWKRWVCQEVIPWQCMAVLYLSLIQMCCHRVENMLTYTRACQWNCKGKKSRLGWEYSFRSKIKEFSVRKCCLASKLLLNHLDLWQSDPSLDQNNSQQLSSPDSKHPLYPSGKGQGPLLNLATCTWTPVDFSIQKERDTLGVWRGMASALEYELQIKRLISRSPADKWGETDGNNAGKRHKKRSGLAFLRRPWSGPEILTTVVMFFEMFGWVSQAPRDTLVHFSFPREKTFEFTRILTARANWVCLNFKRIWCS